MSSVHEVSSRRMSKENKALSRRFWEEVTDQRNLNLAKELFAPDYHHHDPGLPPEVQQSLDAYIGHLPMFYEAFPDLRVTVEDMIAEGDEVATRWTFRGTHKGELMGIPATGKQVEASGITIHRVSGGRIVEGWTILDNLGMMRQLGIVPA